ncbi:MAG: LD-carboxypeptidase [Ignavibacterium sp.]|nr:LD-carboxypeptidase [Ignavibacterium sp.]MDW8374657.1 LD-carboxypeptidase [Ignavibacteriales bacterium]
MKRENFIKSVLLATASTLIPFEKIIPNNSNNSSNIDLFGKKIIKPKKLKKGDTVALVAPGSYISKEELEESIKKINALGFNTVYSDKILNQTGYLAGDDLSRAEDLMEKFEDKNIDGIICVRGGYGCVRILPFLDYKIIRKNPKVLVGYSDVTALMFGIFKNSKLITFHGPVAISTFNDFSIRNFNSVLTENEYPKKFTNATEDLDENPYGVTTIVKGKAKGKLIGGNLSIMVSLIGTDYDVSYDDAIVFIEEVSEEPYRIDRMLTQLIQAKKFDNAAGIMMGIFRKCEPKTEEPSFSKSFTLMEVIQDRLSNLKIPVIYGMSFGHIKNKFTIPFGANAILDTEEQTFVLEESPVI